MSALDSAFGIRALFVAGVERTFRNRLNFGSGFSVEEGTDADGRPWSDVSFNPGAVTGTGDVVGPAAAVDSRIAVFDTTTGKLIKDGGSTIAGVLAAAASAAAALYVTLTSWAAELAVFSSASASVTPATADAASYYRLTNAAPTFVLPTNAVQAFPVGKVLIVVGTNGQVAVDFSSVTAGAKPSDCNAKSRIAGSTIALKKIATNTWDIAGDLEPIP